MPLLTRPFAPSSAQALLADVAGRLSPAHLAAARTGLGTVMLVRPRVLPTLYGVDSATSTRVGWLVQMLGAREVALGLGTLAALRSPDRAAGRVWLAAGLLSDTVDALAMGGALARGRVTKASGAGSIAVAVGAVALGARALKRDERDV